MFYFLNFHEKWETNAILWHEKWETNAILWDKWIDWKLARKLEKEVTLSIARDILYLMTDYEKLIT